jgi:hypothetical protein
MKQSYMVKILTRLYTRPARPPVNASSPPSRAAPHDSGPVWVANPLTPGCRRCKEKRKAPPEATTTRGAPGSRAVTDPVHVRKHLAWEPGDPAFTPDGTRLGIGAKPAQRAGCALHRNADEVCELGAGSGHSQLFRWSFARMAGEVHRAPDCGPRRRAAHPKMAECRRVGGRGNEPGRKKGRPRAAVHRRCWPMSIFTTGSTCGPKRGVESTPAVT